MEADPGEQNNVAGQHPETVAQLKQRTEAFQSEMIQQQRPAGKAW